MSAESKRLLEERFDDLLDRVSAGDLDAEAPEIVELMDSIDRAAERLEVALLLRAQFADLAREAEEDLAAVGSVQDADRVRVRAAFAELRAEQEGTQRRGGWSTLLAAAGLILATAAVLGWIASRETTPDGPSIPPGLLGGIPGLQLEPVDGGGQQARWDAVVGADRYRVRLLLAEQEPALLDETLRETSWVLPEDAGGARWLLWEAIDAFGTAIAVERVELTQ